MTPDPAKVAELSAALKSGGWAGVMHADTRDEAIWLYRSKLDPRVLAVTCVPRRRGGPPATISYGLGDRSEDVLLSVLGAITREDDVCTLYDALEDLAAAILKLDAAPADAEAEL
jgi:hypothetical protein